MGERASKAEMLGEIENWNKIGYKVKSFTITPIKGEKRG